MCFVHNRQVYATPFNMENENSWKKTALELQISLFRLVMKIIQKSAKKNGTSFAIIILD